MPCHRCDNIEVDLLKYMLVDEKTRDMNLFLRSLESASPCFECGRRLY